MRKVMRIILTAVSVLLIPMSIYCCLITHQFGVAFMILCLLQAPLLFLALKRPDIPCAVQIGTVLGGLPFFCLLVCFPLFLESAFLSGVTGFDASMPAMVLIEIMAFFGMYHGYVWVMEKKMALIESLSGGDLDDKVRAMKMYVRPGEAGLVGSAVYAAIMLKTTLPVVALTWYLPLISAFPFLVFLVPAVQKIRLYKLLLQNLSDSGMLEQAAMDFAKSEDYMKQTVRCGCLFIFKRHLGTILECSRLTELVLYWDRGYKSSFWRLMAVTSNGEKVDIFTFADAQLKKYYSSEVLPIVHQIRDQSLSCRIKVTDKDDNETDFDSFVP